jgi:hypothetical protein
MRSNDSEISESAPKSRSRPGAAARGATAGWISYPAVLTDVSSQTPLARRAGPFFAMKKTGRAFPFAEDDPKELNLDRFLDADRGTG